MDLRWIRGEELAATSSIEVVGLGFPKRSGLDWVQLENIATDGTHKFAIDGIAVQNAIGLMKVAPHVLWHSHSGELTGPSETDVEFFPTWLVGIGCVFHVPTGLTTLYDETGLISSLQSHDVVTTTKQG